MAEVRDDLAGFFDLVREINPGVRVVLTVSPVSIVATATDNHVLTASTYTKSLLRVAASDVADAYDDVTYFPSYEIVTGPQADHAFFEPDRRSVSALGVDTVMRAFLANCEPADDRAALAEPVPIQLMHPLMGVAQAVVDAECEEAAAEA